MECRERHNCLQPLTRRPTMHASDHATVLNLAGFMDVICALSDTSALLRWINCQRSNYPLDTGRTHVPRTDRHP